MTIRIVIHMMIEWIRIGCDVVTLIVCARMVGGLKTDNRVISMANHAQTQAAIQDSQSIMLDNHTRIILAALPKKRTRKSVTTKEISTNG